jgi:general secretion pathway protein C
MDLARRINQLKEQPPEQWLKAGNRYLIPASTAALVLALAYQLATLTWALVPAQVTDIPRLPPQAGAAANPGTGAGPDFAVLLDAHLFGLAPAEPLGPAPPPAAVVDAPDTNLSLKLTGLQAYPDPAAGQAIIDGGRGQEKIYRVGETIEGGSGAVLHSVLEDRVILNRDGRLESLRLPREPSSRGAVAANSRVALPTAAPAAAGSLRDVISENASQITDIIRVAPHLEGGQMIGFRISPGRDRARFEAFGFQPGDIVTDVNGTMLDDPSRGLQIFEALGESTQASVTVLREGTPQVLTIDTSQMQSVAEGLQ